MLYIGRARFFNIAIRVSYLKATHFRRVPTTDAVNYKLPKAKLFNLILKIK